MKACRRCEVTQPISEYYPRGASTHNVCKACQRAAALASHRKLSGDPAYIERRRRYARQYYAEHKDQWKTGSKKVRAAYSALDYAKSTGKVVPPDLCEDCGHDFSTWRREAHHEDYDKPLDVSWVCSRCHGQRHTAKAGV